MSAVGAHGALANGAMHRDIGAYEIGQRIEEACCQIRPTEI